MKRFSVLIFIWALTGAAWAQDSSQAAAIAARQEAAERDRAFSAQLEALQQMVNLQQKNINLLANENGELRRKLAETERGLREAIGNTVTQKQLEKVVESLKEVDRKRIADRDLLVDQIKKVAEIAARPVEPIIVKEPAPAPAPAPTSARPPEKIEKERDKEKVTDETPLTNPNGYFTYKIKSGDRLVGIIAAYNEELKGKGKALITLDQVKKSNPKLNPNNLMVGREILIPVPPDK